jgi:iron complex transport system permease protein
MTPQSIPRSRRPLARFLFWSVLLGAALLAAVIVSSGLGFVPIGPGDVGRVLAARLLDDPSRLAGMDPLLPAVVLDVRLPRILTAAAVGAALALSGTVFQGILRNPLADPYTLGVSAGAAFGAAVALLLNIGA